MIAAACGRLDSPCHLLHLPLHLLQPFQRTWLLKLRKTEKYRKGLWICSPRTMSPSSTHSTPCTTAWKRSFWSSRTRLMRDVLHLCDPWMEQELCAPAMQEAGILATSAGFSEGCDLGTHAGSSFLLRLMETEGWGVGPSTI